MPGHGIERRRRALAKGIVRRSAAAVPSLDRLEPIRSVWIPGTGRPGKHLGMRRRLAPESHATPGYPGRGEALGSPAAHRGDDAPLTHLA